MYHVKIVTITLILGVLSFSLDYGKVNAIRLKNLENFHISNQRNGIYIKRDDFELKENFSEKLVNRETLDIKEQSNTGIKDRENRWLKHSNNPNQEKIRKHGKFPDSRRRPDQQMG
ncbi:hypothetical protein BB561_006420, partial [Smittium simulii]